jgi:hypothetical protein
VNGEHVRPVAQLPEVLRYVEGLEVDRRAVGVASGGEGIPGARAGSIHGQHFDAVQVSHEAIVELDIQRELIELRQVDPGNVERYSQVGGAVDAQHL